MSRKAKLLKSATNIARVLLKIIVVLVFGLLLVDQCSFCESNKLNDTIYLRDLEQILSVAQKQYHKQNYGIALEFFKRYIQKSTLVKPDNLKLMSAIDQTGRIYLFEQDNPDAAIQFLGGLSSGSKADGSTRR